MKRNHCICLAFSLCVVFLLLQLSLWHYATKQEIENSVIFGEVLNFCQNNRLPTFIADPAVLIQISSMSLKKKKNCIFCGDMNNYIVLGVEGRFMDTETGSMLQYFEQTKNIKVDCDYGTFPWNTTGHIPLHCYFQKQKLIIHLVIFHEINKEFWWHGSVIKSNSRYDGISFGHSDGAYKRIITRKLQVEGLQLRIPNNLNNFLKEITQSMFVPCNYTRVHNFGKKYMTSSVFEDSHYFKIKAVTLIQQAKKVLDELDIPFWLSSGTCLGWFRQCSIIPYSKDVDFGVFIKDYNNALVPSMQKAGLRLKHKFGKVADSLELSFQADKIKLDIFFFYEDKNYTWNGGTQTSTGNKFKYIFPKFTLCWTYFFQMKIRVPCETMFYIEANYGQHWFEPVSEWDWKASPPNVRRNGIWPRIEWDEVINVYD